MDYKALLVIHLVIHAHIHTLIVGSYIIAALNKMTISSTKPSDRRYQTTKVADNCEEEGH